MNFCVLMGKFHHLNFAPKIVLLITAKCAREIKYIVYYYPSWYIKFESILYALKTRIYD